MCANEYQQIAYMYMQDLHGYRRLVYVKKMPVDKERIQIVDCSCETKITLRLLVKLFSLYTSRLQCCPCTVCTRVLLFKIELISHRSLINVGNT